VSFLVTLTLDVEPIPPRGKTGSPANKARARWAALLSVRLWEAFWREYNRTLRGL
jgi:hypothetical protein